MVDALASGASTRKGVEVQVLSWAPLIFLKTSAFFAMLYLRPVNTLFLPQNAISNATLTSTYAN